MDIEILSALVAFRDQWVGLMLDRVRVSERKRKMKESKCEKDCLCTFFFFFKETNACESWEEPVAFVRVWEEEASTSVFLMAITRTFITSRDPYGLCFLSSFSINLNSLKTQWNVKCYEYLYLFVAFSCCMIWCECSSGRVLYFLLVTTLSVWKCDFVLVKFVWGKTLKACYSLEVSSEVDVVNVWHVPIESLCLKWLRMHFLCFVNQREVWNKTEFD